MPPLSKFQSLIVGSVSIVMIANACANDHNGEIDALIQTFDSLRIEAHVPGLAIAVIRDTTILGLAGLGHANLETRQPVDPDTPFRIASVSKPIAATVALLLQQKGMLDLDAPMRGFRGFPELCVDAKAAGGIFFDDWACDDPRLTLRHVLSMTANGQPGERFFYNPVSYSWASRPMAQAAGQEFSDLVAELVLRPVGMSRSARIHRDLPLPPALSEDLATPYHLDDDSTLVPSSLPGAQGDGAAGGIVSTTRDLASFDVALNRGDLLDSASREVLWTPQGPEIPYGLGWFVTEMAGARVVWHTGLWEGAFSALYLKLPDQRYSLILLANSDGLQWDTRLDEAALERSPFARTFVQMVLDHAPFDD